MAVRPAVVAGARLLRCCVAADSRSSRWSRSTPTRSRIHEFLVNCGERRDGGREGQVGSRELLKYRRIVRRRQSKIVECLFETANRWRNPG